MPPYEKITSFQNPRVKLAHRLHDKPHRERERLFCVDDARDLQRALAQHYTPEYALFAPALADADTTRLVQDLPCPVYDVPPDVLARASYRQNPGGVVAVLRQPAPLTHLAGITAPLVLVLVDLRKPGNIGALLRTADAAGFRAVLLVDSALDLYNPNIIRSSTGACFLRNIYCISSQDALQYLPQAGYRLVAGHLDGRRSLYDIDFRQKTALLLGTEDTGLKALWRDHCDDLVKIPVVGSVTDSLNVSVAGAIFMYEALRQTLARP
ncbi:MAG: RNA methyltransferase [Anaerolineae bacterium]|jgi:TrmH family RNA methyltransferase|nr:RNA methyltransferase [Anaerolineae bacterium]